MTGRSVRWVLGSVVLVVLWSCHGGSPSVRASEGGARPAAGWFAAGDRPNDYTMGRDPRVAHAGGASGFIKAIPSASAYGFGTLMQNVSAAKYRGQRLRLSGWVKAEGVANWAGLWMRVDGQSNRMLAFDNMQDRPIKGTHDWKQFGVVLDVPDEAEGIAFGILLSGGKGEVWLDDVQLDIVGKDVPTTNHAAPPRTGPENLGFES